MSGNSSTWRCLVAVRRDSGVVWGRFDHERPGFGTAEWAVMIGATCLLVVVAIVSYWRSKRQKIEFLRNSSSHMFGELSREHRLDRANRRLLKKLAAAQGAENASMLFVEPDCFDATKLPPALKPSASELRQLRHELFE